MSTDDDLQPIPARRGTATFVPKGSTIKIVNTSGTQVIDTWAFALPDPPKTLKESGGSKSDVEQEEKEKEEEAEAASKKTDKQKQPPKQDKKEPDAPNAKKGRKGKDMGLPSQEEAEAATSKGVSESEQQAEQQQQKSGKGWTSYLPSLRGGAKKEEPTDAEKQESDAVANKAQEKANSRTWGSYLSPGEGFTSYLPGKESISAFAATHSRDTSKSYAEQLADFSKTPVGAASFSAITGSGAAGSLYAGYSAWNKGRNENPAMEYLSLAHTRAKTLHLTPRVNDVFVSNLREPMLTLVEDTCKGKHDTLMAACDPKRYAELGVEDSEEHGSCAENLVLALKEINERAGLKGPRGIGADVTINSVPLPLNLFMNVPWSGDRGDLKFSPPDCKPGDYVRLRAERDVVVIMSACPQDKTEINGKDKQINDGHFSIETPDDDDSEVDAKKALEKTMPPKKQKPKNPAPKKLGQTSRKPSSTVQPDNVSPPSASSEKGSDDGKPANAAPKKPNGAPTTSTPLRQTKPGVAAASRPRGKPKKLVDPTTGEKKKPKKLEKRGSAAPSAGSNGVAEKQAAAGGANES